MCIHELTTNSLKYGALSRPGGRVDIDWRTDDGSSLSFRWRETGGPRVVAPTRRGFGSRLIERLTRHELNGEIDHAYQPEGLIVSGRFKLPEGRRWRVH